MKQNTRQKLTLLSVLAHPDDESFGMGGTLAHYARQGVDVHLICATRGEVGDVDPHYMRGFNSVAERREHELRCAAEILGLAGVHFLDYRDSGMPGSADNLHPRALAAAPLEEVAQHVLRYILELKPQVVLTFDPIGGYRHPDHIAMHKAARQAFELAVENPSAGSGGYRPQKLYYNTFPRGFLKFVVKLLPLFGQDPHRWGRNKDIDIAELANENFPVHAVIDYKDVVEQKAEASACHASQGGVGMGAGLMGLAMRLAGKKDIFMRAYPPPQPGKRERDLFANLHPL
jgi:N-acetyl-1-D-myo-inositol-2-amino-2-deoxy-alpha-D-glucopyranoside deacetylase